MIMTRMRIMMRTTIMRKIMMRTIMSNNNDTQDHSMILIKRDKILEKNIITFTTEFLNYYYQIKTIVYYYHHIINIMMISMMITIIGVKFTIYDPFYYILMKKNALDQSLDLMTWHTTRRIWQSVPLYRLIDE